MQGKVLSFIREHDLIGKGDRVLVALSGGPDSVALCLLLKRLRSQVGCTLFVAHYDHGIRSQSEKDRAFCENLCAKHRLPFVWEAGRLGAGASEAQSRRARYDFLGRAAAQFSCRKIATGHNRDDQAETVLLHLVRGTGLQGLAGIAPARPLAGTRSRVTVVRPLLPINRLEILEFLAREKADFIVDATNRQPVYLRNRVRLELLPILQRYNPNIAESLFRLSQILSADYQHLAEEAATFLKQHPADNTGRATSGTHAGYAFPVKKFRKLPASIQREVLRQAISRLKGEAFRVSYEEIERTRSLFLSGRGRSVAVAGKVQVVVAKDECLLYLVQPR